MSMTQWTHGTPASTLGNGFGTWWTIAWAVVLALAIADWIVVAAWRGGLVEMALKPMVMIALTLLAVRAGALGHTAGRWLVAGLLLGLIGDVMLLGEGTTRFLGGLGAFLLGHLAYVAAFVALGLRRATLAWVGVAIMAVLLVLTRAVLPATFSDGGPALAVPVALYMTVIAAMLVTAWATGSTVIGMGATLFALSDSLLALNRFVEPLSWSGPAVMSTYHLGQMLIVWGVLTSLAGTTAAVGPVSHLVER